jgi:DNA polymerase
MDQVRSVTSEERRRALDQIASEVAVCTRCPLAQTRTLAVPGEGHPDTEVVFVGEGPGYNEDQQGRPFVGAAGSLLNDLLRQIGWKRQDVFITNVVKCRPPGNRDPEPGEIAACSPYLKRQLAVLDPAVIVSLGRHSLGYFNPGARIGQTHGTTRPVDADTGAAQAVTFAMYHPAAALRQGSLKQTMLADMSNLPQVLIDARARRAAPTEARPIGEPVPEPEPVVVAVEPEVVAVQVTSEETVLVPIGAQSTGQPNEDSPAVDENQMNLFGT